MTANSVIKLKEWKTYTPEDTPTLKNLELTEEDKRFLDEIQENNKRQLKILELKAGLQVETFQWVGTVKFSDLTLHIEPKMSDVPENLITLIQFAYGLDRTRIYKPRIRFKADTSYLIELIVMIFRAELKNILKRGLCRGYVRMQEPLQTLRGRPNIKRQIAKHMAKPLPLECDFDEHIADVPENRIILATLQALCYYNLSPKLGRWIKQMREMFSLTCSEAKDRHVWTQHRFVYNRTNSHYRSIHPLCRLLLGGKGVKDIFVEKGANVNAFLLDMNSLFERVVKELLEGYLSSDYTVDYQFRSISVEKNGGSYKAIKPDFIIRERYSKKIISILDAKYKDYEYKKISAGDIYQLFFYGYAFSKDPTREIPAMLLYPSTKGADHYLEAVDKGGHERKIYVRTIDLQELCEYVRDENRGKLRTLACSLIPNRKGVMTPCQPSTTSPTART